MTVECRSRTFWLLALAVVAGVFYAATWFGWTHDWRWLSRVDATALDAGWRIGVEHGAWVTFWHVLCSVFSPVTFRLLGIGLIVYEFTRRRRSSPSRSALPRKRGDPQHRCRVALFLIVTVELSGVVTELAKRLADRPRPETAMVDAASTSFPSGHALGSMVAVLALAVVLLPRLHRHLWPWAIAAGVLVVISVGVGRVALNVHHPSDVVAGWALGYLYFAACLPLLGRPVMAADEIPAAPGSAR